MARESLVKRFANVVANSITEQQSAVEKASPSALNVSNQPVTTDLTSFIAQLAQNHGFRPSNATPLPQDANLGFPFGAGYPVQPQAINYSEDGRQPNPRRSEFQIAQNIQQGANKLIPFNVLRESSRQIDIVRKCITAWKSKLTGLEWDFIVAEKASESIIKEKGGSHTRAMALARQDYSDDIARLKEFWEKPDRTMGYTFSQWLSLFIEENLVIDGVAIYPLQTVGGALHSLQIVDGTTIKPLIDDNGMRPMPPAPAFQQILYGFARSEFAAPDEMERAENELAENELIYLVRYPNVDSVYGTSPTEQSLAVADIYLRRQQWVRMEFTEGAMPEQYFVADTSFTPQQLAQYEAIFNNELAGKTQARLRIKLVPFGLTPHESMSYGEKYKDIMDESFAVAVCGHFQIQPTEVGIVQKSGGGLGASGHQSGQAKSSEVVGLVPYSKWIAEMITEISRQYLGMPDEVEFKFMSSTREDAKETAEANDIELRNGKTSVNEQRAASGLPLLDSPDADLPIYVVGNHAYKLTEDQGWQPLVPAPEVVETGTLDSTGGDQTDAEVIGGKQTPEVKKAQDELRSFKRWIRKSPTRPFNFETLPDVYGDMLNKFVALGDYDMAEWQADQYLL